MSKLGYVIRSARVKRHMSIGDLSQQSEAHPGMISKIERGYLPAFDTWLGVIASALDIDLAELTRIWEVDRHMTIVLYNAADVGARYRRRRERAEHEVSSGAS